MDISINKGFGKLLVAPETTESLVKLRIVLEGSEHLGG